MRKDSLFSSRCEERKGFEKTLKESKSVKELWGTFETRSRNLLLSNRRFKSGSLSLSLTFFPFPIFFFALSLVPVSIPDVYFYSNTAEFLHGVVTTARTLLTFRSRCSTKVCPQVEIAEATSLLIESLGEGKNRWNAILSTHYTWIASLSKEREENSYKRILTLA